MWEHTSLAPSRGYRALLTVILGMLTAFGSLSIDMYLPGLPAIARELNADAAAAQRTLAVFFLGMALGQVLYGPISDRLGRRGPLIVGCALYALACMGCALAPSIRLLMGFRFAQALGACAGTVIARSVVRDLFDPRDSARMYSFLMLMMGLAPITAPLIGGQILVAFGWRAIFVVLSGFGLACLTAALLGLPETLAPERRSQVGLGAALRAYGGLLTDGRFMAYTAASALAVGAMFAYIAGSPFVFIELHGVRPERYGFLFGANALGLVSASQLNHWLLRHYGSGQILRVGLGIMAGSGLLLLAATALAVGGFGGMLVLLFCCIATYGLVQPNAVALAMAPHGRQAGVASALIGGCQSTLGAAVGALVGLLHNGTALPMAGVIAACATAACFTLRGMGLRPLHAERER